MNSTGERSESPARAAAGPGPIEDIDLAAYAATCHALVRAGGNARRAAEVLREAGLSTERWQAIRAEWTERIRSDPGVRAAFRRRYAQIE